MPKLPFKLPNLGAEAEKALIFSVDRSKLPPLNTYSLPTPWNNDDSVLHVMSYLYDRHSGDDGALKITPEHAAYLFSVAPPCVFNPVAALIEQGSRRARQCAGAGVRHARDGPARVGLVAGQSRAPPHQCRLADVSHRPYGLY